MKDFNISEKSKQGMLKNVSAKMGISPSELQKQLESGKINELTKGLSQDDAQRLANALSNPALAKKILSTPQAQEILNKLKK